MTDEKQLGAYVTPRVKHEPGRRALGYSALLFLVTVVALALLLPGPRGAVTGVLTDRPGDLATTENATTASLVVFWRQEMPRTYHKEYVDLRGGYQPKSPQSKPWACNGKTVTYDDIRGNAFYCGGKDDDYIAYDGAGLFPRLNRVFGSIAPAVVLAHETGHAVQFRAAVSAPSVVIELQADCFGGAWVAFAERSRADRVDVTPTARDSAVAVMLTLRDRVGTPATDPQAHGMGFDRVNAFQTGYEQGTSACARFPTTGVTTTELPFQPGEEAATGGDLPYRDAVPFFVKSLDDFWRSGLPLLGTDASFLPPRARPVAATLPACDQETQPSRTLVLEYCSADNTVTWVDPMLQNVHTAIGDMSTGTLLSEAWAEAAQTQAGLSTVGRQGSLQRDCLTGAWISTIAAGADPQLRLSPGDLDEVIGAIVTNSFGAAAQGNALGGAFDRTRALRQGVQGGIAACT